MALEISNAQFNQFVQFAQQAGKATTIAQMGDAAEAGALAGRTIVAKTSHDFIGNVGRFKPSRDVNNAVRALFKKSVADMFGGEDHIPDNVRDAMKMQDYGQGKPLTARRILAVQKAIEDVRSPSSYLDCSPTVEDAAGKLRNNVLANADIGKNNKFKAEDVAKAVDAAIEEAGQDLDLMNVLKDELVLDKVFLSNGYLRTEEGVKARVAAIRANVNELREATGGDKSLFYMGLRCLIGMNGKTLDAGVITSIVNQVRTANIGELRKISGSSDVMQLHKGILQYVKHVDDILLSSRALASFKGELGGDDISHARNFIGRLLIARCSQSNQNAILEALQGNACGKLKGVYYSLGQMRGRDFGNDARLERLIQANLCGGAIDTIASIVSPEGAKIQVADEAEDEDKIPKDSKLFNKIAGEIMSRAETSLADKTRSILGDFVSGSGQGADIVRDAFGNRIKGIGINNAGQKVFKAQMDRVALNGLHYNIMTNAKDFATAGTLDDTLFAKGLQRLLNKGSVTIGGRKLSSNVQDAADQIAQFVTGGARKYAELDGREKMKAFVVMSLVTQNTVQTLSRDMLIALDPNQKHMPFTVVDDGADEEINSHLTMDIALDERGGLKVDAKYVNYIHTVHEGRNVEPSEEDLRRPTAGRTITSGVKLELSGDAFNQYAELGAPKTYTGTVNGQQVDTQIDITKLDDTEAKKIEGDDTVENKTEAMVKALGKSFQIPKDGVRCLASYKAELD